MKSAVFSTLHHLIAFLAFWHSRIILQDNNKLIGRENKKAEIEIFLYNTVDLHIYIRYTHAYTEILITKKNKNKKEKPTSFKRVKE